MPPSHQAWVMSSGACPPISSWRMGEHGGNCKIKKAATLCTSSANFGAPYSQSWIIRVLFRTDCVKELMWWGVRLQWLRRRPISCFISFTPDKIVVSVFLCRTLVQLWTFPLHLSRIFISAGLPLVQGFASIFGTQDLSLQILKNPIFDHCEFFLRHLILWTVF